MNELILLKTGEIVLKGLNRSKFEDMLIRNTKYALHDIGAFRIYKAQSTLYAEPLEACDLDLAMERLSKVFGYAALSRARIVEKDFSAIQTAAVEYLREELMDVRTFKVNAKRADKTFPMNSPEICCQLGEHLLQAFPHLKVDVHQPQMTVTVEIRDFAAYIHQGQIAGAGGIPVGCSGNAALLLSGGIDSPVAGYMMAKRGLKISAIHFVSPPYTSERAQDKVETLCAKITPWLGRVRLYIVPFTQLQERIRERCPEDLFTIVMRRYMMRIAEKIAVQYDCGALITGESVGQVASQTLGAIACTDLAATMPILRPVVGMDKEEIIAIARKIGTFDTSIQPYEDCCTVFTPRHPKTNPRLAEVLDAEAKIAADDLIEKAVQEVQYKLISG